MMRRRGDLRVGAALLLAGATFGALACGSGPESAEPETIETGRFIDAYVDLRIAALRAGVTVITPEDRERILDRHQLSEKDLLKFVEVHGRDARFMHSVWDSIESRIDDERVESRDSARAPSTGGA